MTTRQQLFTNNATTVLTSGINAFDTVINVKDARRFPEPAANQFFLVTLDNGVDIEIIEVTSRVGNTLSGVTRALEGTNAAYFAEGTRVEVRVTAGYLDTVEALKAEVDTLSAAETSLDDVSRIVFTEVPGTQVPRSLTWNSAEQTLDLSLGTSGVVLQVGQESLYRVKNNSGQPIVDGTVVMAAGTVGNSGRILIQPAIANGLYEGKQFLGLVTETIANGADGFVTHFGKVRGIPTNGASVGEAWADGDILYAHPTIAGKLTKVKPAIPNEIVTIAIVISAHATNGTLFIRPTIDSHKADVAKYQPATGSAISVQDALLNIEANDMPMGGGANRVFYENDIVVTEDYTITTGRNAMSAGPIEVAAGKVVTVPSGSVWTIV